MPCSMEKDLQLISIKLRELSKLKPTASYIVEVDEALASKHEGIKVCAAKTLGAWGDSSSIEKLKNLLETIAKLEARWGAASAISRALAPNLNDEDIPWVVNLILRNSNCRNRFVLYQLFQYLSESECIRQLEKEELSGGIDKKQVRYARNAILRART